MWIFWRQAGWPQGIQVRFELKRTWSFY